VSEKWQPVFHYYYGYTLYELEKFQRTCLLYNCGYNFPTVSNSPLTPIKTSFDIKPSSQNGTITGQILANDAILCGGIASTQWRVTLMKDQQTALQPTHSFVASFTLSARNMS
jgi:hypothetical protein